MKSEIHGVTVTSKYPYIVYGAVRGLVSQHRALLGAVRSLDADRRGCRRQGGFSDARVYRGEGGRWTPVLAYERMPDGWARDDWAE